MQQIDEAQQDSLLSKRLEPLYEITNTWKRDATAQTK